MAQEFSARFARHKDELDWLNNYHRQVFEKLAPRLNDEEREWLAKKCAAIGC